MWIKTQDGKLVNFSQCFVLEISACEGWSRIMANLSCGWICLGAFRTEGRCRKVLDDISEAYKQSGRTEWATHCNNLGSYNVPYHMEENTVYVVPAE